MKPTATVPDASDDAPEKIRIAFGITELAPGGAEKALLQLVSTLDRTRFEPVVYVLSGLARDAKNSLAPLFRELGVDVVNLGAKGAFDLPRVVRRWTKELKSFRPSVLQTFLWHSNILGRVAGRLAGVPLVCAGVRVAERDSRSRLKIDYWTRSLCDVWVCVGESVAAFSRTVGRLPAEKVVSIPNGVRFARGDGGETSAFVPGNALRTRGDASDDSANPVPQGFGTRRRILCVGRLTRQKGFDRLLETASTWLTPETADDWELWIVGDGEERSALAELVRRKGLANRVVLTGWRSDLPKLYAESEIFALPSRWEGMPNALLEAAAAGKPALCSDVEGVAEILGPNAEPQTVPVDENGDFDPEVWRVKIAELMRNNDLRATLGRLDRERVATEFTVERSTRKYEALWTRLLSEKRSGRRERSKEH